MFKKILKCSLKILLWLLLILIIGVVVAYFTASIWIKPVVSSVVPKITKTSASLESADISLFSGRLAIKGLKIANPDGFSQPYALELGEFSLQFQPKSIFTNKIIVDRLLIKGTKIVAEYNQKAQMNLMVLNDNIQASTKQKDASNAANTPEKAQVKSETKSKKTVVIRDLQILDTTFLFPIMGQVATFTLPNIQEKNIGEKKKMTFAQSIQLVSDKLILEPIQEVIKSSRKGLKDAFKVIEDHTKDNGVINSLKSIFSEANFF